MISLSSAVKELMNSATNFKRGLADEIVARQNDHASLKDEIDVKIKQSINHIDKKIGIAGGIVPLGDDGKIPSQYIPGSVDDVITYSSASAFPRPGSKSVIYVDATTGDSYRWAGESYISMNTQTSVSERALKADRLGNPRRINGVEFDGSKDITLYDSTKISRYGDVMEGNLKVPTLNGQPVGKKTGWNTIPNVSDTGEENIGKQLTFNTTDNSAGDAKQVRITAMNDGSLSIEKINGSLNGTAKEATHAAEADHAKDATTWKGYTNAIETEKNTADADETWIPVVDGKTLKHTTKKNLKVGDAEHADHADLPQNFTALDTGEWGNQSGTHVTGWTAKNGGSVDFREDGTQLNMKVDGVMYQREGSHIVIDDSTINDYAPTKTGVGASGNWNIDITGTAANASKLGGLPLGASSTDLAYNFVPHVDKDGIMEIGKHIDFHATGSDGKDYPSRFTAEADGSVTVNNINGHLKGDITGFGQPRFNDGTWYNVGDDAKIGDFNHAGLFGICGLNAASGIGIAKKGAEADYASIVYDGDNLNFNKKLGASITGDADGTANKATNDGAGRNIQNGYLFRNNGAVSNLNTVWTEGIYTYNQDATGSPTNGYGRLVVLNQNLNDSKGWVEQIAYDTNGNTYKRQSINNATWSTWSTYAYLTSKVANATYADSAGTVAWDSVSDKPSLMTTGGGEFSGDVTAPQFYTPNWFRAQGNGGIYWEKWGGGWYMSDSSWIRAYQDKDVCTAGVMKADGGFQGNLSGIASNATQLDSQGDLTCTNSREAAGLRMYQAYSNGWPTAYGNVISVGGSGGGQLLLGWSGDTNGIARIYYRNRRDCVDTWSDWKTIAWTDDKPATASRADTAERADGASYSDVAKLVGKDGGTGGGMKFHWSGQGGQPSWLWGGSNGTDMYVYNPSNFSVNYARSAGAVTWDNITGKPDVVVRDTGTIYTNNWFRSRGNTGWYSENYGGGWFMQDTTWIRAYNDKNIYTGGSISVGGTISGSKVYNAVYNDYAEFFEKEESIRFEPGDIVALDDSRKGEELYVKATDKSKIIVGVCTNEFAHIIGGKAKTIEENEKDFVPVSLMGRVHVKVKGDIEVGDKITASDTPGIGRKAQPGEHSIGTALTDIKDGKVRVLINL